MSAIEHEQHHDDDAATLLLSREVVDVLLDAAADASILIGSAQELLWVSPGATRLLGWSEQELRSFGPLALVHHEDLAAALVALGSLIDGTDADDPPLRLRLRRREREPVWVEVKGTDLRDVPGVDGLMLSARDVTARVEAEAETQHLIEILELTDDLVSVVDGSSSLLYMNPACRRFFGLGDDEVEAMIGTLWRVGEVGDRMEGRAQFERGDLVWSGDVALTDADGRKVPHDVRVVAHTDHDGAIVRFSAIARDVSRAKELEADLQRQASHDTLTGLPNRAVLERHIRERAERPEAFAPAVLFVDLDHFKRINDRLGHEFGDRLLQQVAHRLRSVVRPSDTVVRYGGDEFVIVCDSLSSPERADELARRVLDALQAPFEIEQHQLSVSASIGIASADREGVVDHDALVREADLAMYRAKAQGRSRWVRGSGPSATAADAPSAARARLRAAVDEQAFELRYQPIVELATGRLLAVEALVRWRRDRHLLLPAAFLSVAESDGIVAELDDWVLDRATAELCRLRSVVGWSHLGLALNVSRHLLGRDDVVERVLGVLEGRTLEPASLMIEIAEPSITECREVELGNLERLRDHGVGVAVDDVGVGGASLVELSGLAADVLKLDRSLLAGLGSTGADQRTVAAVIALAAATGARTVAEGIESAEQYAELERLGCDAGQGYHVARPMTATAIEACLEGIAADAPWRRGLPLPAIRSDAGAFRRR